MKNDDCSCPRCSPADPRPAMMMFMAFLMLMAALACIKIHDRSSIWIKSHQGKTK